MAIVERKQHALPPLLLRTTTMKSVIAFLLALLAVSSVQAFMGTPLAVRSQVSAVRPSRVPPVCDPLTNSVVCPCACLCEL